MDWFIVMANYPDDPKIQAVGERGEVLFHRGLAYCARANTDGFIPETALGTFKLPRVNVRVAALVMIGLWITDELDGIPGYRVKNWDVIQSLAYSYERKKRKDAARRAALRGLPADDESQSHIDGRTTVVRRKERERELTPLPPAERGDCDGTHDNCRGCGTTRRQQAQARRTWKPDWCGHCDERTRLVGYDGPTPVRCHDCHPKLALAPDIESA